MKRICFYAIITLTFAACSPSYYLPTKANVPLFKEKGEGAIQAHFGATENHNFIGLNSAYAVTNNVGLMLNASNFYTTNNPELIQSNINIENNQNYNPKSNLFMGEIGVGYFKPISRDSVFIFETYAGYGFYSGNKVLNDLQSISYNIHRPFIQPSIGVRYKWIEASYGVRFTQLYFTNNQPSTAFEADELAMFGYQQWNKTFRFEQSLTIGIGNDRIKGQIQWLNTLTPYFNEDIDDILEGFSNVSLGIQYRF